MYDLFDVLAERNAMDERCFLTPDYRCFLGIARLYEVVLGVYGCYLGFISFLEWVNGVICYTYVL